jgi:hypothetical protein
VAKRFEDAGVAALVHTDIARDGMLAGPNLEATAALAAEGDASSAGDLRSRGAGNGPLPTMVFSGDGGEARVVGLQPYERYAEAASNVGAKSLGGEPPSVEELLARFGTVTMREVEAVCELPGPRAGAALFRLAEQWRLRPVWRMTGFLFISEAA